MDFHLNCWFDITCGSADAFGEFDCEIANSLTFYVLKLIFTTNMYLIDSLWCASGPKLAKGIFWENIGVIHIKVIFYLLCPLFLPFALLFDFLGYKWILLCPQPMVILYVLSVKFYCEFTTNMFENEFAASHETAQRHVGDRTIYRFIDRRDVNVISLN